MSPGIDATVSDGSHITPGPTEAAKSPQFRVKHTDALRQLAAPSADFWPVESAKRIDAKRWVAADSAYLVFPARLAPGFTEPIRPALRRRARVEKAKEEPNPRPVTGMSAVAGKDSGSHALAPPPNGSFVDFDCHIQ